MYRPGQWVFYNDTLGLVFSAEDDATVVFHAVTPDGATLYEQRVPVAYLRYATADDVPVSRRPVVPLPSMTWSEKLWLSFSQMWAKTSPWK